MRTATPIVIGPNSASNAAQTTAGKEATEPLKLSPSRFCAFELFVEPFVERREVVDDRGRVHLVRARHHGERLRPRLRLAERQHRVQLLSGRFALVNRTAMERQRAACRPGERAMKLELQDVGEKVPRVR